MKCRVRGREGNVTERARESFVLLIPASGRSLLREGRLPVPRSTLLLCRSVHRYRFRSLLSQVQDEVLTAHGGQEANSGRKVRVRP